MRPSTYIVDIDGVILKHKEAGSSAQWTPSCWGDENVLLPGVLEVFDAWEKEGACIVLMTARPNTDAMRAELETTLRSLGVFWHHLVMGVTSGDRVLINDYNPLGAYGTRANVLNRNEGLSIHFRY